MKICIYLSQYGQSISRSRSKEYHEIPGLAFPDDQIQSADKPTVTSTEPNPISLSSLSN